VNKLQGYVKNGTISQAQAAGLAATMSLYSKGEAGTYAQNFLEATLTAQVKGRHTRLEGGQSESTAEYLSKLGVHNEKDPFKVAGIIASDLANARQKPGFIDDVSYLYEHGYGNKLAAESLQAYSGSLNSKELTEIQRRVDAPLVFDPKGVGPISALHAERAAKDPFFQKLKVERAAELERFKKGKAEEPYELARQAAYAQMLKDNPSISPYDQWAPKGTLTEFASDIGSGIAGTGTFGELNARTHAGLEREARRLGLNVDPLAAIGSPLDQDKALARRITDAGGDVTASTAMKDLAQGARDFAEVMKKAKQDITPKIPAPVQGRPNQPVLRP
jgi:phage FluMu protein gp41